MAKNKFIEYEIKGKGWRVGYKKRSVKEIRDAADALAGFSEEVVEGFGKYHGELSDKVIEAARSIILRQQFQPPNLGAKLSDLTVKRKGHDAIYLDKYKFINNFEIIVGTKKLSAIWAASRTRVLFWYVGPNSSTHPKSKITYQEIASMMEYGTKNQPPRPFWDSQMVDVVNNIVNNTEVRFAKAGVLYINRLDKL